LTKSKPANLFTVTLDNPKSAPTPYYLRANVLTNFSAAGWSGGGHDGDALASTNFQTNPPAPALPTETFTAHLVISGLADNPPVFGNPVAVGGLSGSTKWDATDQLLIGTHVSKHMEIDETVAQPAPTIADLKAAGVSYPPEIGERYLINPGTTVPSSVTELVQQIIRGKHTPYDIARAISDYFTTAANGFVYSLQTAPGDSNSALVNFLDQKKGFCQQFAAAMGIMLRVAGVPSRVVLGYTHPLVNDNGAFTVTTNNAH